MGKKKSTMVLGYTRSGHEVLLPTRETPDMSECASWTPGDHLDASRILVEHGEREVDEQIGNWCMDWARGHRKTAKAPRRTRIRGAAETAILSRRRR